MMMMMNTIEGDIGKDCESLITKFEEKAKDSNISFDNFAHAWKEMGFNYIYSMQHYDEDIVKTTTVAMIFAKHIMTKDSTLYRKVGALYLLYCLYYKQPTEFYVKIEMTIECWKALKSLLVLLASCGYSNEPKYIFWKLKMDKAFRFVFSDCYYALESFFNPALLFNSQLIDGTKLQSVVGDELKFLENEKTGYLAELNKLEDEYNVLKNGLNSKYESTDLKYVSLQSLDIVKDLKTSMTKIDGILNMKADDGPSQSDNEEIELSSIAIQRNKIKQKARAVNTSKPFCANLHQVLLPDQDVQTLL